MNEISMNNAVTMRPDTNASLGRIDQYELIRELGGGGFGCVYLARDTVAGIDVAVKGLPPLVRFNKEELENVRKNFALVSRLHHPNIAAALTLHPVAQAIYDDKSDAEKLRVFNGDTLVVMQYAPGVTLSQWRKQFPDGKVPLDKALEITRQIASALDYAHKEKILHRDIKPANVMIETGADGKIVARVLDFGLAAEIRSSMSRVSQSVTDTSGTRPYMAPEQWLGEKQGFETDQYSLAVLFYELITGEVPFASVFDTGDPVLMMNVVGNREFNPSTELSKPIRLALTKALSKKREDRFDSCTAFVDALVGRGVLTAPSGKAFGKIAAVGLLVLGLAGGVWYWQDAKAKEEARIVAEQKAEAERKAAEEARRIAEEKAKKEKVEAERKQKEEAAREAEKKTEAERRAAEAKRIAKKESVKADTEKRAREVSEKIAENTRLAIKAFEAKQWEEGYRLSKDADLNDKEIQCYLGFMYWKGYGVTKDYSEAVKWYRKATEQGESVAQNNLGMMYYEGHYVSKDYSEAVKWFRKSAEQGNAGAQNNLGDMYRNGRGVTKDYSEAVKWFRKSAEQGNAVAQYNLGDMYREGHGVPKDYSEAVKWYRKSAEQGNAGAQNTLGRMYQEGYGVLKDDSEAVKWYRKSVGQGLAVAQYNLGCMYEHGRGVPKDYSEAVKWYRKAAEQGYAVAQRNLGLTYVNGWGVLKDYSEAVKWLRKSAEQGEAVAQFFLGAMYEKGLGVAEDETEAAKWYRKVVEQGEKEDVAIEVRRVAEMAKGNLGLIQHKGPLRTLETKAKAEAEGVRKTEDAKIGAENKAKDEGVKRIQLWEGGPYWADRNIGAERPEDFGYYFWWGDIVGYKRMIAVVYGRERDKWVASNGSNSNFRFDPNNTPTYRMDNSDLESQGWIEMKNDTYICLTLEHDAAHKHWGGAWRMPTKQELDDLNKKCDWSWEMRNGVNGYIVRGKGSYASKSIFLPAAGYVDFDNLKNVGSHGYLWSSELKIFGRSYRLLFDSGFHATGNEPVRYGQSVRPVQGFSK